MPCHQPIHAWQQPNKTITIGGVHKEARPLQLPCGKCLACRMDKARDWAIRCQLELQEHQTASFTTLTYDDQYLPPTLQKRDLQLFLKRMRKGGKLRFFASGEYGDTTYRPHYHAILYGVNKNQNDRIETAWQKGHTRTHEVTPATIAYVAGYTVKKIRSQFDQQNDEERVDPETGEVYDWQQPFVQMSRKPGIGGEARKWAQSWRSFAIQNGHTVPVPRFLHEAYKKQATPIQLEELEYEKYLHIMKKVTKEKQQNTKTEQLQILQKKEDYRLKTLEIIAQAQQRKQDEKRTL